MNLIFLNRRAKGWLISSVLVLLVSITVFAFRKHFGETIVLWVVVLTPIVLLILALLCGQFTKKH